MKWLKIKRFLHSRMLKTIWFNFKMLPFKQAVRLPVFIFGKTEFRDLSGKIIIDCPRVWPGMIRIGAKEAYVDYSRHHKIHWPMQFLFW